MIGQISLVGPLCAAKNPSKPLGHGWMQDLWRRPLVSDTGTFFVLMHPLDKQFGFYCGEFWLGFVWVFFFFFFLFLYSADSEQLLW